MKERPEIVTFSITSNCNNDCFHCFAPKKVPELEISDLKNVFKLFEKIGVKGVLLTGGEPLLRNDFKEIVESLKLHNQKIYLDTDSDYFFKYAELIRNNVNTIGFPIDFPDRSYRNPINLNNVLDALRYLKRFEKRPKIRIGTTVTKDNYKELSQIGNLIKNYPVDIWKIYEFTPQGENAIKNREVLEISKDEFNEATNKLVEQYSSFFKVIISNNEDRTNAYFMINPNGTVCLPIGGSDNWEYKVIGNILDENITKNWSKTVSQQKYLNNINNTF